MLLTKLFYSRLPKIWHFLTFVGAFLHGNKDSNPL
jgi:hypothetical protein